MGQVRSWDKALTSFPFMNACNIVLGQARFMGQALFWDKALASMPSVNAFESSWDRPASGDRPALGTRHWLRDVSMNALENAWDIFQVLAKVTNALCID